MSDITMCKGYGCPKQLDCYRVSAPVNPYAQSYFVNVPFEDGECKYFMEIFKDEIKQTS